MLLFKPRDLLLLTEEYFIITYVRVDIKAAFNHQGCIATVCNLCMFKRNGKWFSVRSAVKKRILKSLSSSHTVVVGVNKHITPPKKYSREEVKGGRRKNILWFEQGPSLCTSTWGDVLSYIPLVPASIQDTQPESHRWQGAGENEWGTEWRSREEEERRWRRSWGNLKVFCYRSVNINSNRSDLWCFRFEGNRRVCLLRPCWNSLEEMRERHKKLWLY